MTMIPVWYLVRPVGCVLAYRSERLVKMGVKKEQVCCNNVILNKAHLCRNGAIELICLSIFCKNDRTILFNINKCIMSCYFNDGP